MIKQQELENTQTDQAAVENQPAVAEQESESKKTIEVMSGNARVLKPGINFFRDVAIVTIPVHTKVTTNPQNEVSIGWSPLAVASDRSMQWLAGETISTGKQVFEIGRAAKVSSKLARWKYEDIERFCRGEEIDPVKVFKRVVNLHNKYLDYPDEGAAMALALWAIGTYFYPMFPAYPYAELNGPRGSGKSKQMSLTSRLALNGRVIVSATQGTVFRVIEECRGTVCFDEAEMFGEGKATVLMQILNEGYTSGATVPRCDPHTGDFHEYEVYSPKMFASIRGIDSTTASRCIRFQCLRAKDKKRGDLHITDEGENWDRIRHKLYSLALSEFKAVREAYETKEVRPFTNRDNEKWAPLLAIAKVIDDRGEKGTFARVLKFARGTVHENVESSLPPFDEAVLRTLHAQTKATPCLDIEPAGLLTRVRLDTNDKWTKTTSQLAGYTLKRLGFKRGRNRVGSFYRVTSKEVLNLATRYDVTLEDQGG